jgi:hypothetical protein
MALQTNYIDSEEDDSISGYSAVYSHQGSDHPDDGGSKHL